jgi:Glycosyl transferases group 1
MPVAEARMPEEPQTQVLANAAAYERLLAVVDWRIRSRRWDSAASWARIAASFAVSNPCGFLREPRLELALDEVALAAIPPVSRKDAQVWPPRHVLHVLSEGHRIGGHVRMALRWIQTDQDTCPDVIVTRPGCDSPELAAAATQRGGSGRAFTQRSLIARARELREAASTADVVVCHTHPDDPVPALAFGGSYEGPPVVMVNHADHAYWLGVGNVAVVMNLRAIDPSLTSARGYPDDSVMVVPIPAPDTDRSRGRATAKRELGIRSTQCVLVTLARALKYERTYWHPGFAEVVAPALRELPQATLIAVGADPHNAAWAQLQREFRGRVLIPGLQPDPSRYLDAADVYLDSFPFGSTTSMLEAATRDIPVLASGQYDRLGYLLSSSGVLDEVVLRAPDPETYREQLHRLVSDSTFREVAGAATGAAVRSRHGAAAWRVQLERVYERALSARPVTWRSTSGGDAGAESEYAEVLLGIEARTPLLWTIELARTGFDVTDRVSSRARTWMVRAVQRARGQGAGAGAVWAAILIPRRLMRRSAARHGRARGRSILRFEGAEAHPSCADPLRTND